MVEYYNEGIGNSVEYQNASIDALGGYYEESGFGEDTSALGFMFGNAPIQTFETNISSARMEVCLQLVSVSLPNLTYAAEDMFMGCINLSYVELPAVESLDEPGVFRDIEGVVSLPVCSFIAEGAFGTNPGEASITSLYLGSTAVVLFDNIDDTIYDIVDKIYVPTSLLTAYQTTYPSYSSYFYSF